MNTPKHDNKVNTYKIVHMAKSRLVLGILKR